ncbi:MAG: tetratricopeptide repeat protein [Candidatus Firestonebacteria bacterium]|nr:tetratricopeptide repeat protein [Candidatus Firestonebacteria bacterium]
MIYQNEGNYDDAFNHYQKSLKIFDNIEDNDGVASSFHEIGRVYQKKGNYDEALKHYQKSLEIKEKIKDMQGIAMTYGSIGTLYFDKKEYIPALKFSLKAYSIFLKLASPNINLAKRDILKVKGKISEEKFNDILKEFNIKPEAFNL